MRHNTTSKVSTKRLSAVFEENSNSYRRQLKATACRTLYRIDWTWRVFVSTEFRIQLLVISVTSISNSVSRLYGRASNTPFPWLSLFNLFFIRSCCYYLSIPFVLCGGGSDGGLRLSRLCVLLINRNEEEKKNWNEWRDSLPWRKREREDQPGFGGGQEVDSNKMTSEQKKLLINPAVFFSTYPNSNTTRAASQLEGILSFLVSYLFSFCSSSLFTMGKSLTGDKELVKIRHDFFHVEQAEW